MSYATYDELKEQLPERIIIALTDDDNLGAVDMAKVATALEKASVTIDSYLASRYPLPFAEAPPILSSLCVDLAGQRLHLLRNEENTLWVKQSDNAISFLEKLASGALSLGAADPAGSGDNENIQVSAPDALFGSDELDKY